MSAHLFVHVAYVAVHALTAHTLTAHTLTAHLAQIVAGQPSHDPLAGSSGAATHPVAKPPYDAFLVDVLQALIFLANLAGGVVVGVAVVRGLIIYAFDLARRRGRAVLNKEAIRLELGRSLALALEFQLGADILGTSLDPTLQDILVLGAIVILRTVLNYFLGQEIREEANRVKAGDQNTVEDATPRGRRPS